MQELAADGLGGLLLLEGAAAAVLELLEFHRRVGALRLECLETLLDRAEPRVVCVLRRLVLAQPGRRLVVGAFGGLHLLLSRRERHLALGAARARRCERLARRPDLAVHRLELQRELLRRLLRRRERLGRSLLLLLRRADGRLGLLESLVAVALEVGEPRLQRVATLRRGGKRGGGGLSGGLRLGELGGELLELCGQHVSLARLQRLVVHLELVRLQLELG